MLSSGHRRSNSSNWALNHKIVRPPSAAGLIGYQAVKQENQGYFATNQRGQLFGGGLTSKKKLNSVTRSAQMSITSAVSSTRKSSQRHVVVQ